MKLKLFDPHGPLTPEIAGDAILLAGGGDVPQAVIGQWSPHELAIAFDWAIREHMAASDNAVQRRPKPWFVTVAELIEHPGVFCTADGKLIPRVDEAGA
jgi:hypothetical protein